MATTDAVAAALQRSLQSSRERGWRVRQGADDFQPQPQPEPWRAPAPWPSSVTRENYENMQRNPEATRAWFEAPRANREALINWGNQQKAAAAAAYARNPAAAHAWFTAPDENRRRLMGWPS